VRNLSSNKIRHKTYKEV